MKCLQPQAGPQTAFLASSADICIFGGSAGGGKTFALLLEPLRYKNMAGFNGVIFRRNYTQVTAPGGLWETSKQMYTGIRGAVPWKSPKRHWDFAGLSTLSFDYIASDDDVYSWQGSQICFLGFDELTHFSEFVFFYMLSRNRSTCGVKPYVRATCNPDADSWVKEFISWWIDPETGLAISERSGVQRVFYRTDDGGIVWGNTREEVMEIVNADRAKDERILADDCKTATFIASSVYDNKILLKSNPQYLSSLKALSLVQKERLLRGNWKIRPAAGLYFNREKAHVVEAVPEKIVSIMRAWDLAATEITPENKNPDRTAGVLIGRMRDGRYIVLDVVRRAYNAAEVRALIRATAEHDNDVYRSRNIRLPQDPGQAGKAQAGSYVKELAGWNVKTATVSGSKITRAEPFSAQWMAGNVLLLKGDWNEMYLSEMDAFPDGLHDDMVDASSDAFASVSNMTSWRALAH